ncbi:hypothetical protein [Rubrimonas cliftonensis]|uniref:Uncharacterized protein n=1 Tax=Rubrimonas cliftonensis TaxID=89524 RepID=A0A1H3W4P5_9RHOB|nr:hypothetical protein [Rubrimonas cliftonensis]SDZ81970.1 hypothetical protein SAMN05444370_101511 [Rubrimonas cliftonensis]
MELIFRRRAEHVGLPEPTPAASGLPDWLRAMPSTAPSAAAGAEVRTLKHCPPLIDAMGAGVLAPLAADVEVAGGVLRWTSDIAPLDGVSPSPIGVHVPEQAAGGPLDPGDGFIVKFMNFWAIEAPPGWSVLATHPANRLDLPFRTLTGLVDCDRFALGLVHFPALWIDPGFEGVLRRGTPVAQLLAVPRAQPALRLAVLSDAEAAEQAALRARLAAEPGVYRRMKRGGDRP